MSDAPRQVPPPDNPRETRPAVSPPLGPLSVLGSVFGAWFGVQSEARRQRDFGSGNARPFIIAGLIFVVVMVIAVVIAANLAITATNS